MRNLVCFVLQISLSKTYLCLACVLICVVALSPSASAQFGGGGGMGGGGMGGGGGQGGGGQGGGGQGSGSQAGGSGVIVDPQGVLRVLAMPDSNLTKIRQRSSIERLPQNLRRPSKLRKVALGRLEAALAATLDSDGFRFGLLGVVSSTRAFGISAA